MTQPAMTAAERGRIGDWFNFFKDQGGRTIPVGKGSPYENGFANGLGLRQGYRSVIENKDIAGSWFARTDTAAHERFHSVIGQHLPSIWDVGDLTVGGVPVGAPIKYLEEVGAYGVGHAAAFRFHAIPFAPLEAFGSLNTASERWVAAGALVGGGAAVYYYNTQ
jgi:hypothetical protein